MSQNLTMRRGDTATYTVTVTQAGAAYNLTGSIMRFTAKWAFTDSDGDALFARTSPSSGITFTNAAGGIASVTLAPANTSTLPGSEVRLNYDIQVTDGSGNVYTVIDGLLIVLPDVSIATP